MNNVKGFTLVELLIVVVIIAILASVAFPAYQSQVKAARRADCAGALVGFAGAMERFFTTNSSYIGAGSAGGGGNTTGAPTIYSAQCPIDGGTPTYNLTILNATATAFVVQAAPVGAQANDRCGTLTLNNVGLKAIVGARPGLTAQDCW